MQYRFNNIEINPIHENDAWKLCDFITANADRLKQDFPKTLRQNLTPDLSRIFADKKVKEFAQKKEFLFTLKEIQNRTIVGLVYVKEIDLEKEEAELAYCIGYQYEGKGITTKAVQHISSWALKEVKVTTLQIIAHKSNLGSVSVAKNCGYKWKKSLPKAHTTFSGEIMDMELYELSK